MGQLRVVLAVLPAFSALTLWAVGLPRELYLPALVAAGLLGVGVAVRGPDRPALAAASSVFVATALTLAVGDLALRILQRDARRAMPAQLRYPPNPDLARMPKNGHWEREAHGDLSRMSGDPDDRVLHWVELSSGPLGFRNRGPFPTEPLDLIVLGDSFAAGSGVSDDHVWDRTFEARGLSTYNLSVVGTPWAMLMNLKAELPNLPTDSETIVLWALFTGNDLDYKYEDYLDFEPYGAWAQWRERYRSFRRQSPLRQAFDAWTLPTRQVLRGAHDRRFLYLPEYATASRRRLADVEGHFNYPLLVGVFEEMGRFAASHPLRVVVTLVPTKWEVYAWLADPGNAALAEAPSGFSEAIGRLSRAEGFPYLDLKPALLSEARRAWSQGEYLWWSDDTHFNVRGYGFSAEVIADSLLAPTGASGSRGSSSSTTWPPPRITSATR